MQEIIRQARAIAALELTRLVRTPATIIALVGFVAILLVGHWQHWRTLPPRPDDDRLFGYAFLIAAMVGLRFGFSHDRVRGSDRLLIGNLVEPAGFFLGKVAALVIALAALTIFAFVTGGLISVGDWGFALWYSALFTLVIWLFAPVLLLAELVLDTRYPGPAVFVFFVLTVTVATFTIGVPRFVELMGFGVERFDFSTLAPLTWRAPIAAALLALLYPLWRLRTLGRGTFR